MAILLWDNQQDAEDSLDSTNSVYGCPYLNGNGYRMDQWARVVKSPFEETEEQTYGFIKPEARLGKGMDALMIGLIPGYTEKPYRPEDFDEEIDL